MTSATAGPTRNERRGLAGAIVRFTRWLNGPVMRWVALPVQLGLRLWVFFMLPFINSGLTKWEAFPFLKPAGLSWNGGPTLAASVKYQFTNACEFCFNLRIWGTGENPLVQWVFPFPQTMAALAGYAELLLPALILIGLLTRLSALGLLGMTIVIQLVIPTALPLHAMWALIFLAIFVLGPGMISADHLLGRALRR